MHPLLHRPVPGRHPESGSPRDVTAAPTTMPRETQPQAGRDVSFTAFWDFFFSGVWFLKQGNNNGLLEMGWRLAARTN